MEDFEERVRARAYRLWQEEGCPEGRAQTHWKLARELIAIEDNQKSTTKPIPREETLGPSGGPITKDQTSVEYYGVIFAFAESPKQRGVLWAGSDEALRRRTPGVAAIASAMRATTSRRLPSLTFGTHSIAPGPFTKGDCT